MGDFNYEGEHSLTITVAGQTIRTWDPKNGWYLAPKERPFVASPPVKEEYIDVPGADGSLDYTEVLTNSVHYGNRTGSWTFLVDNGYAPALEIQSKLLNFMHGRKATVILDDEPDYYYEGRLTLDPKFNAKDYNQVVIKYNFSPFKFPITGTGSYDWKWNDLFGNTITYGSFQVKNDKMRVLYNDNSTSVVATINVSNPMKLTFGTDIRTLNTGDNEITLQPGGNLMLFEGTGRVKVNYARRSLL